MTGDCENGRRKKGKDIGGNEKVRLGDFMGRMMAEEARVRKAESIVSSFVVVAQNRKERLVWGQQCCVELVVILFKFYIAYLERYTHNIFTIFTGFTMLI